MKYLYETPVIMVEELIKEDVLCNSLISSSAKDTVTVDGKGSGSVNSLTDIMEWGKENF